MRFTVNCCVLHVTLENFVRKFYHRATPTRRKATGTGRCQWKVPDTVIEELGVAYIRLSMRVLIIRSHGQRPGSKLVFSSYHHVSPLDKKLCSTLSLSTQVNN